MHPKRLISRFDAEYLEFWLVQLAISTVRASIIDVLGPLTVIAGKSIAPGIIDSSMFNLLICSFDQLQ